jgi:hypothetical protein
MKKKFNQKLSLNKKTIANLSQNEMDSMNGGRVPNSAPCTVTLAWPEECQFTIFKCPDPENPTEWTEEVC